MVDVLIQTHNEEINLPSALKSVMGWANKVFVVDSGSTDGTIGIAEQMGAQVVHHDWEGYAGQKNWAISNLPWESDWILIVDADEAATPQLRREIDEVVAKPSERVRESGFYINRMFIFMGREIRHCGYYPSWNLRLFKRGRAKYEDRLVHEHMLVDGPTAHLKGLLTHEDRRGLEHFIAKHNRYSTLEAQEIYSSRVPWPGTRRFLRDRMARRRFLKTRVLPKLPVPWMWKFLYMYIFLEGFLDRSAGWNLCLFIATYEYFINVKYKELNRMHGRQTAVSGLSVGEGKLLASEAPVRRAAAPTPLPKKTAWLPLVSVVEVPLHSPETSSAISIQSPNCAARAGRVPVSVLIPALNEARNLPRCLDHLTWADEVVVVDSGSQDDTQKIADAYGAAVVQFKWNGLWPKKKNWALANVPFKHEWVLIVDADEWITPELADEIEQAVKNTEHVGYYINRKFIFMGGWIKHCGYYPSWNLRLIRHGCGQYEQLTDIGDTSSGDNEVHEHITPTGPVAHLKNDMLHFAFPTIHTFMEKHNRYSNWEAAVQYNSRLSDSASIGTKLSGRRRLKNLSRYMPMRSALRFFYSYILRGGILDGRPGYIFCRLLAMYEYLSVAKYLELCRLEEDQFRQRSLSAVPTAQSPVVSQAQ